MTDLTFLYEAAREYGREPRDWPRSIMVDVVLDLYVANASFLDDAIASLDRQSIIELMRTPKALGLEVRATLIDYPLDWFAQQISSHYDDWLSRIEREERYAELSNVGDAA